MLIVSSLRRLLGCLRVGAAGAIGQMAWWVCQIVILAVLAVLRLTDRGHAAGREIAHPVTVPQEH